MQLIFRCNFRQKYRRCVSNLIASPIIIRADKNRAWAVAIVVAVTIVDGNALFMHPLWVGALSKIEKDANLACKLHDNMQRRTGQRPEQQSFPYVWFSVRYLYQKVVF